MSEQEENGTQRKLGQLTAETRSLCHSLDLLREEMRLGLDRIDTNRAKQVEALQFQMVDCQRRERADLTAIEGMIEAQTELLGLQIGKNTRRSITATLTAGGAMALSFAVLAWFIQHVIAITRILATK